MGCSCSAMATEEDIATVPPSSTTVPTEAQRYYLIDAYEFKKAASHPAARPRSHQQSPATNGVMHHSPSRQAANAIYAGGKDENSINPVHWTDDILQEFEELDALALREEGFQSYEPETPTWWMSAAAEKTQLNEHHTRCCRQFVGSIRDLAAGIEL